MRWRALVAWASLVLWWHSTRLLVPWEDLRLRCAWRVFRAATVVARTLHPDQGWPPRVCFWVGRPLVRGLCHLACWLAPRDKGEG